MIKRRHFTWARHLVVVGVLGLLDLHKALRRQLSRDFLRVVGLVLATILAIVVLFSLGALVQITRSIQSLITDSMVGLEASVDMRATVRSSQIDLLSIPTTTGKKMSADDVKGFLNNMNRLMVDYRTGIFDEVDRANADAIQGALDLYMLSLVPLLDKVNPGVAEIRSADQAARNLIEAVEDAYQFNRDRVHASADEAGGAARKALLIANRLGWSFGVFLVGIGCLYFAYRWLAMPEDKNA
jgi:hypothetical protein